MSGNSVELMEDACSVFCDKYCRFPLECKNQDELDEHCDRCEIIRIINKDIAEKPLEIKSEYDGDYGKCPNCGKVVTDYQEFRRCSDCGKALDWSDTG